MLGIVKIRRVSKFWTCSNLARIPVPGTTITPLNEHSTNTNGLLRLSSTDAAALSRSRKSRSVSDESRFQIKNQHYVYQISVFSTNSVLCGKYNKKVKSFKYDPEFPEELKQELKNKKRGKSESAGIQSKTTKNAKKVDETIVKMSSEELEEEDKLNEPIDLEDQAIIDAVNRSKLTRSDTVTEDAEVTLKSLINDFPKLKSIDAEVLTKYMEFMSMYGFRPVQSAEMAILHPSIMKTHETSVDQSVLTWRSLGYNERDILTILQCYPQLVDLPSLDLRTRYAFLASYLTREETLYAVINCIQIVYNHENVVRAKLDYLIKTACHSTKTIVRSLVLSHPFKHIQLRHEFLVRAGLFKLDDYYQLHKKLYMLHPRIPRDRYFTPSEIVCTNDKEFLRFCTNNTLSLNELAAFEEMYEKERQRDDLLLSDDEDEDETEEEDDDAEDEEEATKHGSNNSSAFFSRKDAADFYY